MTPSASDVLRGVQSAGSADGAPEQPTSSQKTIMTAVKFVYWQEKDFWIGYLQDYPDYLTQGVSLDELKENLHDLYRDITSGDIPGL